MIFANLFGNFLITRNTLLAPNPTQPIGITQGSSGTVYAIGNDILANQWFMISASIKWQSTFAVEACIYVESSAGPPLGDRQNITGVLSRPPFFGPYVSIGSDMDANTYAEQTAMFDGYVSDVKLYNRYNVNPNVGGRALYMNGSMYMDQLIGYWRLNTSTP
jgi:hypothetical protein